MKKTASAKKCRRPADPAARKKPRTDASKRDDRPLEAMTPRTAFEMMLCAEARRVYDVLPEQEKNRVAAIRLHSWGDKADDNSNARFNGMTYSQIVLLILAPMKQRTVEAFGLVDYVSSHGWTLRDGSYISPEDFDKIRQIETEQEATGRAEAVGRARIEYESALAAAGVKAAQSVPVPVADQSAESTTAQPGKSAKKKRGRPKAKRSTPQARARAAAYVAIVEYAAEHPELSVTGARRDCAEQHGGDGDFQYFADGENAKKWGQRHGVQFSVLVEMCRDEPQAWMRKKEELTS